jgi:uncharacterized protein
LSFYFDACVLVPLFVEEDASAAVSRFVERATGETAVSDMAIAEFGAALSHHVRSRRSTEKAANSILTLFDQWVAGDAERIAVAPTDIIRAGAIVRRFDLKLLTPDAIHAAVCERLGLTLVTLDGRLADAGERLGVAVVVPN